ncbi:MAG: MBL fold metallo-hydrolase [Hymenobacter sp.]
MSTPVTWEEVRRLPGGDQICDSPATTYCNGWTSTGISSSRCSARASASRNPGSRDDHRLGQLGQNAAELSAVLLTHTHIDHTGGLGPVVFAAYMQERSGPVTVLGPAGRDMHPGTRRFTDLLFGEEGAWNYLTTFDGFGIEAIECVSDLPPLPPRRGRSPTSPCEAHRCSTG